MRDAQFIIRISLGLMTAAGSVGLTGAVTVKENASCVSGGRFAGRAGLVVTEIGRFE